MVTPTQARSRYKQVRSGPAGNRAMGFNPAAKPAPRTMPTLPKTAAPRAKERLGTIEGAMKTGSMASNPLKRVLKKIK